MHTRNTLIFIAIVVLVMTSLSACATNEDGTESIDMEKLYHMTFVMRENFTSHEAGVLLQEYVNEWAEFPHTITNVKLNDTYKCGTFSLENGTLVTSCSVDVTYTLDESPDWKGYCTFYDVLPNECVAYLRGG